MIRDTVQRNFYFVARRFVAGSNIGDAIVAVRALNAEGMSATLDFLGEDVHVADAACRTREVYEEILDAIAQSGVDSNVSVKLTAMGLLFDENFALDNLVAILERAARNSDPFVRIDMEGSAVVEATLRVFQQAFAAHPNVGPVLQSYLKRTPADVDNAIALRARVRLVKGAYNESPEIAYRSMPKIRTQYLEQARRLLLHGNYPGIATHDRRLIAAVKEFVASERLPRESFEFQMLYGCRPSVQREIVAQGYRLRIYVPFGTHWAGYFYRRVLERRENALFAISSIFSR
jgi:proline dehydrogenase